MKSRTLWLSGALALTAGVSLLAACQSTGSIPPKNWWLGGPSTMYCVESATAKLKIPEGMRGKLSFKDGNGQPVGPASHIDGGIEIEVPIPVGAKAYDWDTSGSLQTLSAWDSNPASAPQLAGIAAPTLGTTEHQAMPFFFEKGCMVTEFDPHGTNFVNMLHTITYDGSAALAQMEAVIEGGVGTPVPPSVSVDAFITITIEGENVKLVSSMIEEFTTYTATLNGYVVADLGVGLNASVSQGANGWISVTSYMPLALLNGGETLYLLQQGGGAVQPIYLAIQ